MVNKYIIHLFYNHAAAEIIQFFYLLIKPRSSLVNVMKALSTRVWNAYKIFAQLALEEEFPRSLARRYRYHSSHSLCSICQIRWYSLESGSRIFGSWKMKFRNINIIIQEKWNTYNPLFNDVHVMVFLPVGVLSNCQGRK